MRALAVLAAGLALGFAGSACEGSIGGRTPADNNPTDATSNAAPDALPRDGDPPDATPDAAQPDPADAGAQPADAGVAPDASPDAGAEDPFSTDSRLFYGSARCAGSGLYLCEDFESSTLGEAPDPTVWGTNDPRLTVGDTFAARGTHALHVITQNTEALHFIRTTRTAPALGHVMWGRVFFRVEGPRPTSFNHWSVVEATGTTPEGGTARMRFGGINFPNRNLNRFLFNYDIWGARPPGWHEVGTAEDIDIADHTWHCIEWLFDIDTQRVRFFHDAVERPMLGAEDIIEDIDLSFPEMDGLNIGWAIYQDLAGETWEVWVDEVAADSQRIGCVR